MPSDKAVVEVRGVSKRFGDRAVLSDVNLTVHCGESLVILGGSGSGKSTLLRCMMGLERPDSGTVRIFGTDLFDTDARTLADVRKRMGVAFQAGALFGSMTVADNVELPLREFTRMPAYKRRIISRIKLGMVGLEDSLHLYPSQLSGGMRKRAALARALALDPDVVFFDEPSAGLDPMTAAAFDRLICQLRRAFDTTLVVVTHEMQSAFNIADRLALLHRGRFVVVDTPERVRASDEPVVRDFLDRVPAVTEDGTRKFENFIDQLQWNE